MGRVSDYLGFEMMKEQLSGEYREAFEAVLSYGILKNISQDILTERLTELYDTLLTAQSEGREARRVVGEDRQRFCRDIFQDYTFWDSTREQFGRICTVVWLLLVFELLRNILTREGWKELKVSVLPYLLAVVCGVLVELLARLLLVPILLKSRKIKASKLNIIFTLVFAFTYGGMLTLARELPLPQWEVPSLWLAIGAGAFFLIFIIPNAIWIYKNSSGSLTGIREQMRRDSYYKGLDDAKNEIMWLNTWKKRYVRLSRKGKSPEDVLRKMKKELRLSPLGEKVGWLFAAAMVLPGIIQRIRNGASDLVFYTLWMGGFMFLGIRFYTKINRQGNAVLKQVIESCEESGLSLPEVIEERLSPKTMGSDDEDQDDTTAGTGSFADDQDDTTVGTGSFADAQDDTPGK